MAVLLCPFVSLEYLLDPLAQDSVDPKSVAPTAQAVAVTLPNAGFGGAMTLGVWAPCGWLWLWVIFR